MIHFIYTIAPIRNKEGHNRAVIVLHRVKKNTPIFIGRYEYSFESEAQAVLNCVKRYKQLSRRYFDEMHPNYIPVWNFVNLKEKEIAQFHRL